MAIGFSDISIFEEINEPIFTVIVNGSVVRFTENGTILFNGIINGSQLRNDDFGNTYISNQFYDKVKNTICNTFQLLKKGNVFESFTNSCDLACENFEIIDSLIVFYSGEGIVKQLNCKLPDSITTNRINPNKGERMWLIGKMGDYYILKTNDFDKKTDSFHFFNNRWNEVYCLELNLTFDEIIQSEKEDVSFLMFFPSANIFSFNNNAIYCLRNTRSGVYVSQIVLKKSK